MNLGNSLFHARKRIGLSQEEVAERICVSRQTISKWETNETVPDLYQAKKLAKLYKVSLDELIQFDIDLQQIDEMIAKSDEKLNDKVNWTNAWGKKYPILLKYQTEVNTMNYAFRITKMFKEIKDEYGYSKQDAMLVLKDILYQAYKAWNK